MTFFAVIHLPLKRLNEELSLSDCSQTSLMSTLISFGERLDFNGYTEVPINGCATFALEHVMRYAIVVSQLRLVPLAKLIASLPSWASHERTVIEQ